MDALGSSLGSLADLLLDPWRSGIGVRALLEIVLLAAICGPLGFWIITYGLSYGAESLAHGLLPGLVVAAVLGVPRLIGGGVAAVSAAALIIAAGRDKRVGPDTATAVVVTGMVGIGALLALAPELPPRLAELLFGDPLTVGVADVVAAGALAVLGGVVLTVLHRPLSAVAFDAAAVRVLGLRAGLVQLGLVALLAAAVCTAVTGLGNLLVLAILVAPAVAVRPHAASPGSAMAAAGIVAAASGVGGLYLSYYLETAAGGSVALALCAAAALGAAVPRRRRRPLGSAGASAAGA